MRTDVLIAGGGLSGLRVAERLAAAGRAALLVEARARLGGRVLSRAAEGAGGARYDLGPAWFWPGQPRIAAALSALGLEAAPQHAEGALLVEGPDGAVARAPFRSGMAGALRIVGGAAALTDALAARLPEGAVALGEELVALARDGEGVRATLRGAAGERELIANAVVLALPPRAAAERIRFSPAPPPQAARALAATPTWMAGMAKLVAVYGSPFWRGAGLSGAAISRRGPMVEIHDASPADGSAGALFGFIGAPPEARRGARAALLDAARAQLGRVFGPEAAAPRDLLLMDWADEPLTTAAGDAAAPVTAHPAYGPPPKLGAPWDGRLHLAGAEHAAQFGGLLEGALEAADAALAALDHAARSWA